MSSLDDILIGPGATILDAVRALDRGARQIALVVGPGRKLLATVTDGDVRRGLLRGVPMDAPVTEVMRRDPHTVLDTEGREKALDLMRRLSIHQVPVIDAKGVVRGLEVLDDLVGLSRRANPVVLMAGGLGMRLRPLTEKLPKPMLRVGGRPLLEAIIGRLRDQGFHRIYIAVGYRKETVQAHFGDGARMGVEIAYLEEEEPLGTAGALSLLPERPEEPLIVMNGDLLTDVNFASLTRFHADQRAEATMCVREFTMQVPYGVVRLEGTRLTGIEEKPSQSFFVSAGIYVLSPAALGLVTPGAPLQMPELFCRLIDDGRAVSAFPVREYWIDIGRMDDLQNARDEFDTVFGP